MLAIFRSPRHRARCDDFCEIICGALAVCDDRKALAHYHSTLHGYYKCFLPADTACSPSEAAFRFVTPYDDLSGAYELAETPHTSSRVHDYLRRLATDGGGDYRQLSAGSAASMLISPRHFIRLGGDTSAAFIYHLSRAADDVDVDDYRSNDMSGLHTRRNITLITFDIIEIITGSQIRQRDYLMRLRSATHENSLASPHLPTVISLGFMMPTF